MSSPTHKSTLDGLPKQFVSYIRVLFDILDEEKTGYVKFADIASRWQGEKVEGLPPGVPEALRKVTPANGKLTFERFVAGLKIALLRRNTQDKKTSPNNLKPQAQSQSDQTDGSRGPLQPDLLIHGPLEQLHPKRTHSPFLAPDQYQSRKNEDSSSLSQSLRPEISKSLPVAPLGMPQQKAYSLPHLGLGLSWEAGLDQDEANDDFKGRRAAQDETEFIPPEVPNGMERDSIVNALKKWQHDRMIGKPTANNTRRWPGDGRASVASASALGEHYGGVSSAQTQDDTREQATSHRRAPAHRRDTRRHTLSSGVDYHMIKRIKQLEQERDVLLQGLEVVEQARGWYQRQVRLVQDKQKYIDGPTAQHEASIEAQQEKLNLRSARIQEVNHQLKALVESEEKGLPIHMNLAVAHNTPQKNDYSSPGGGAVIRLKTQNKVLSEEVTVKSDRIAQLENEKAQLIREMFQATSRNRNVNYDDTTFI